MKRVQLGTSGLEVTPVSIGTWQLSPRFWGQQSKKDYTAALRFAFENGVNFIDTAEAYGDGYAETVVGEAIQGLPRDELVIATKVFNHFNNDGTRYPDLSTEHIIARCNVSLSRMGIETIDLYLLHMFDPLTPLSDIAGALERLRDQGKIRAYGVSNHNVEQTRAHRKFGDYSVTQPPYSLIDPVGEEDLLPYCQSENIGVMIYSPMHKGLLTGKYTGEETFTDFRQGHPDFQGERFRKLAQSVQSLKPLADKYGLTIYQLVLSATLMHPSIDVAVCGVKRQDQIEEAMGAVGKELSREDCFEVRKTVGPGPTKIADTKGSRK
ncbi:MAG: aldo/keto reductase [Candidatus Latescibacterota bacterium]|nr:aldo/keto reductase [Candidatus Latescibacterota bacterium]